MSAILFDLDGVLYQDNKLIPGAAEAVNWFAHDNIPHLFLTNTTSKSRLELVKKLADFGIQTKPENYLTPPVAACQWLTSNNLKTIAAFVPEATRQEFSEFNLVDCEDKQSEDKKVDALIIGDLGERWSFAVMNRVFRMLINNPQARLIALGMTRYWRAASGLQLDVGPMIRAFEYASGVNAIVTGKPAAEFYQAAIVKLKVKDNIVMIGDDIQGDIKAAQQVGLKAIQVRTGKFSASDLDTGIVPDAILDSVADLPQWWQTNM